MTYKKFKKILNATDVLIDSVYDKKHCRVIVDSYGFLVNGCTPRELDHSKIVGIDTWNNNLIIFVKVR